MPEAIVRLGHICFTEFLSYYGVLVSKHYCFVILCKNRVNFSDVTYDVRLDSKLLSKVGCLLSVSVWYL